MHRFILLCGCLYWTCVPAQEPIVRNVEVRHGYEIEVNNPAYLPVSLIFAFDLVNMRTDSPQDTVVVPALSTRTVHRLVAIDRRGSYRFRYTYRSHPGDYRRKAYDTAFVYRLPFAGPVARHVLQGYDGSFSHRGKAALDFELPEGTPVYASRGGRVFEVEVSYDIGCADRACMRFSNVIRIVHPDGTVGEYGHLRKDGSTVEVGEEVAGGDLIGYSGNTGFSTTPHLHFAVYRLLSGRTEFIPTRFDTATGKAVLLLQGRSYARE